MLTISRELAQAFETGNLARWKAEIAATLCRLFPKVAATFPDGKLENWVREAMESIRQMGATSRADMELFTVALFTVTEVDKDDRSTGDLTAILLGQSAFPAKMAMLRKAFPRPD